MKKGKRPNRAQMDVIRAHGYGPEEHLVVKDTACFMEIVGRVEVVRAKLGGRKPRAVMLTK